MRVYHRGGCAHLAQWCTLNTHSVLVSPSVSVKLLGSAVAEGSYSRAMGSQQLWRWKVINSQGQRRLGLPVGGTWGPVQGEGTRCEWRKAVGHLNAERTQNTAKILGKGPALPAEVRQRQDPLVYWYSGKLQVNIHACFLERSYLFPRAPEGSTPHSCQHVLFRNVLVFVKLKGEKDVFS